MSMMTRRTVLPFLLALAVLAIAAAMAYQPTPAAAQSGDTLAAPKVTLTSASNCNPENPRTYLVVSYTAVDGASSYEYRVKWGRDDNLGQWRAVPSYAKPGTPWAPKLNRYAQPGENYLVQVRAVGSDGGKGAAGAGRYFHRVGDFPAPAGVTVAYHPDGDNVDYTKARLTWRGNSESGDWFAVQHRAIGEKWQSTSWNQFSQLDDGDASPYFHDVSGLDAQKGYQFRVAGHSPQCEASPWSEVATLRPAPDAPEFLTSVGRGDGNGHLMGVWVEGPYDGVDYHKFRLGDGGAVQVALPAAQQHRFPVEIGRSYSVCASAGNARGESDFTCRDVTAQVSSPIETLQLVPGKRGPGTLVAYWDTVPFVNPTWLAHHPGSTHAPPLYWAALRQVGDEWATETFETRSPSADLEEWIITTVVRRIFHDVYQIGQSGGASFDDLKENTEYEVMVCSAYYGEADRTANRYDCRTATGRTLMNPVRDLRVGFDADEPGRAIVKWQAPEGASQANYVVTLKKRDGGRRVGRERLGADAVSAAFDGLKTGRWYHVDVISVGDDDARSPVRRCYFKQGTAGSQNRAGADMDPDFRSSSSCAISSPAAD